MRRAARDGPSRTIAGAQQEMSSSSASCGGLGRSTGVGLGGARLGPKLDGGLVDRAVPDDRAHLPPGWPLRKSGRHEQRARRVEVFSPAARVYDAYVRGAFAAAVSGPEVYYLISGHTIPGEPCTPQAPCSVEPRCSDAEPCPLRSTREIVFRPAR